MPCPALLAGCGSVSCQRIRPSAASRSTIATGPFAAVPSMSITAAAVSSGPAPARTAACQRTWPVAGSSRYSRPGAGKFPTATATPAGPAATADQDAVVPAWGPGVSKVQATRPVAGVYAVTGEPPNPELTSSSPAASCIRGRSMSILAAVHRGTPVRSSYAVSLPLEPYRTRPAAAAVPAGSVIARPADCAVGHVYHKELPEHPGHGKTPVRRRHGIGLRAYPRHRQRPVDHTSGSVQSS